MPSSATRRYPGAKLNFLLWPTWIFRSVLWMPPQVSSHILFISLFTFLGQLIFCPLLLAFSFIGIFVTFPLSYPKMLTLIPMISTLEFWISIKLVHNLRLCIYYSGYAFIHRFDLSFWRTESSPSPCISSMIQHFSKCHPDHMHWNNLRVLFIKYIFSILSRISSSRISTLHISK